MKNVSIIFAIFFISGCVLPGCKKGDSGMPGADGTTILSGQGVPADSVGANGDFFLDTAAQILYGPKTAGGWGAGVQLKGNANVVIDTFRVSNADWASDAMYYIGTSEQTSTGFPSRAFVRQEANITKELLNTGVVQAYFTSEPNLNQNNWTALPYSFFTYGGYQINYATETSVGKITFYFYFNKITALPPDLSAYQIPEIKCKILMLPGQLTGGMARCRQSSVPARGD